MVVVVAEQVSALDRAERPAAAEIEIGDAAVIKPDRDEPRVTGAPQPQLLDRQRELLVLVALFPRRAVLRETGEEHQGVAGDRAADLRAPVLARPQLRGIAPHPDAAGLQLVLQLIDVRGIVPVVGDERVPENTPRPRHRRERFINALGMLGEASVEYMRSVSGEIAPPLNIII